MGIANAVLYLLVSLYVVPPTVDRAVDLLFQEHGLPQIANKPHQQALPSPGGEQRGIYGNWKAGLAGFYSSRDAMADAMTEPVTYRCGPPKPN